MPCPRSVTLLGRCISTSGVSVMRFSQDDGITVSIVALCTGWKLLARGVSVVGEFHIIVPLVMIF